MVKVFMLCNPTVYLLVIRGSEGKHILCLISHLLSGWIHSFSEMPYGDNKEITGGREESVYKGELYLSMRVCESWPGGGRAEGKIYVIVLS